MGLRARVAAAGVLAVSSAALANASLEYLGHFASGELSGGGNFSVAGFVYTGGFGSVDVFNSGGAFSEAFGWGVSDG